MKSYGKQMLFFNFKNPKVSLTNLNQITGSQNLNQNQCPVFYWVIYLCRINATSMKKIIYLIAISIITLTACKNETTAVDAALAAQIETFESLKNEAMEVHDEIMPKMGELMELKGEITEKAEAGELSDQTAISSTAEELKASHDGMMTWMKDYSEKFPYGDPTPETKEVMEEKMPILEQEVKEIKNLRDKTMKAIESAKALLNK